MNRFIATLLLLFYFVTAYAQADSARKPIDTAALYAQYKRDLAAFEREHGAYIQTPNVRMHYVTWGSKRGIPLVWSHGTNGNAYEMYWVADSLVKAGYYIIAIDYYGHGLTPVPEKDASLYHVADDIKCLLDHLKIKKAVVGGFSRGGTVATAFYDAYPQYVKGLILEDGGSVAWDVNGHKKSVHDDSVDCANYFKTKQAPRVYASEYELFSRLLARQGGNPQLKKIVFVFFNALKKDTGNTYRLNPAVEELTCEHTVEELQVAAHSPFAAKTLFGATSHLIYPKVIYRTLDVPMLIFDPVGEDDVFDFEAENRLLQQSHPAFITHKVYQNTGHAVKSERPSDFIRDVAEFVRRVK